MPFPQFDPTKKKILFFSRGLGRGHAIPDIEIVRELLATRDDIQVHFVSYATGARTIEQFGYPLIDLCLPELAGTAETTVLTGRLIGGLQPDLVVSHEEFAALPAAKIFNHPTVAILDWFTGPEKYSMRTLAFADHILFLDEPGIWEEPEWVQGKVTYTGQVLRTFQWQRKDRARARRQLNLPPTATVITVMPGSFREEESPLAALVWRAFDAVPAREKRLIWIAGANYDTIASYFDNRPDVSVIREDWEIDRLMVASDLVVTKCTRKTLYELEALGVPSLSVAFGLNPIDERRAPTLRMTRVVAPDDSFTAALHEQLANPPRRARRQAARRSTAAAELAGIVDSLRPH